MRDGREIIRASFALAPDVAKYSRGAEAYDQPARRRDVLDAMRILYEASPPPRLRELLPHYGHGAEMSIDGAEIPFWLMRWVVAVCVCSCALGGTIWLWRHIL